MKTKRFFAFLISLAMIFGVIPITPEVYASSTIDDYVALTVSIKPSSGDNVNIGTEWIAVPINDGNDVFCVFVNNDGYVMDVYGQGIWQGVLIQTWEYNGGDNQRFLLIQDHGNYLIKGVQSGLYLGASSDGEMVLTRQQWATAFELTVGNKKISDSAILTIKNIIKDAEESNFTPAKNITADDLLIESNGNTLYVGDRLKLTVMCFSNDTEYKKVTWSSSDNSVATVDANGLVRGVSAGTATITAKSANGSRAEIDITVESGGSFDKYRYSFFNSPSSFGYKYTEGDFWGNYRIPIERYLQAGFPNILANILALVPWEGSCFGMSASSILFSKDVLQEEKYDSNVHQPIDFSAPSTNSVNDTKLREMIELFHVSQSLPIRSKKVLYKLSPEIYITDMINELDNGNPILLSLKNNNGGHAVVIYDYEKIYDPSEQTCDLVRFKIYDCSNFVSELLLWYSKQEFDFTYISNRCEWFPADYCKFEDLENLYYHIKDVSITKSFNGAVGLLSDEEENYTYIVTSGKLSLTNSEGKTAVIENGEVKGDIEDISVELPSYLSASNEYTIIAPKDTYTFTSYNDEVKEAIIANQNALTTVEIQPQRSAKVSADLREVEFDNPDNSDYAVKYAVYGDMFDEMKISGTGSGKVITALNYSDVVVKGAKTITAAATVSGKEISVSTDNTVSGEAVVSVKNDGDATIQILSESEPLSEAEKLPDREQVSIPEYDLASGSYGEAQTLTFTKDDETVIYYTSDGSEPDENGILYTAPIDVNKSMTVKAIAKKYGYDNSECLTLNYVLPSVANPKASAESGAYETIQSVALENDGGDEIYYTVDGSSPIYNGIKYGCEIVISEDTVLKAVAVRNGIVSDVAEFEYRIDLKNPLAVINTPTDQNGDVVAIDALNGVERVNIVLKNFGAKKIDARAALVCYDKNGSVIKATSKAVSCASGENYIEIEMPECENVDKIKIMFWNSFAKAEPLADTYVVE